VERPVEGHDFRVEDDLVQMLRRLTCVRCWASCLFPLTVYAEAETRHYELVHVCVRVALPWTGGTEELTEFLSGVVRHLRGVSRHARRDVGVRGQVASLIRAAHSLF